MGYKMLLRDLCTEDRGGFFGRISPRELPESHGDHGVEEKARIIGKAEKVGVGRRPDPWAVLAA